MPERACCNRAEPCAPAFSGHGFQQAFSKFESFPSPNVFAAFPHSPWGTPQEGGVIDGSHEHCVNNVGGAAAAPSKYVDSKNRSRVSHKRFEVPLMPVSPNTPVAEAHRPLYPLYRLYLEAAVARPVSKKERQSNPKAQMAIQKEWDRLRDIGCWDESQVYEWSDLASWARDRKIDLHVGRIFDILVEKVLNCLRETLRASSRVESFFKATTYGTRIGTTHCSKICRVLPRLWMPGRLQICMALFLAILLSSLTPLRPIRRQNKRGSPHLFAFLVSSGPSLGPICGTLSVR